NFLKNFLHFYSNWGGCVGATMLQDGLRSIMEATYISGGWVIECISVREAADKWCYHKPDGQLSLR
ncbi:MAG TPA: hypothetical protein DER60_08670, partial [Syntrophomonas sp.]|nr:hypothetical protein [Syntrophomonas sp.]